MAYEDPKYPVTNHAPGVGTVVGNFNMTDYMVLFGAGAGSAMYCWKGVKGIRGPNAAVGGALGLLGGVLLAYQNSHGRLTGQRK